MRVETKCTVWICEKIAKEICEEIAKSDELFLELYKEMPPGLIGGAHNLFKSRMKESQRLVKETVNSYIVYLE